jgi:hypothetical protein
MPRRSRCPTQVGSCSFHYPQECSTPHRSGVPCLQPASTSNQVPEEGPRAWKQFRRYLPSGVQRLFATHTFAFTIGGTCSTLVGGVVVNVDTYAHGYTTCGSAAIDYQPRIPSRLRRLLSPVVREAMAPLARVSSANRHALTCAAETKRNRKQQSACMTRSVVRGLWRDKHFLSGESPRARETLDGLARPGKWTGVVW